MAGQESRIADPARIGAFPSVPQRQAALGLGGMGEPGLARADTALQAATAHAPDAGNAVVAKGTPAKTHPKASMLRVLGIGKRYASHEALRDVSVDVHQGEFVALVGPSGSGKSTLLKIIAGFEQPTAGNIEIDGKDMAGVAAADRPTAMVFQRLALWPHMSIAQNIAFPLRLRRVAEADIDRQVGEMMDLMHLDPAYRTRHPAQLSGGEQQRVALARAMIARPRILLLDEPLSALDVKLRKNLQAELRSLHRKLGVTFVHVTHDLEEAMILADTICVMRNGQVVQRGTPGDIYYRPRTPFVATFIGETNLIPVRLAPGRDGTTVLKPEAGLSGELVVDADQVAPGVDGKGQLLVRPEHLRPGEASPGHAAFRATVTEVFVKGSVIQYRAQSEAGLLPVVFEIQGERQPIATVGERVTLAFSVSDSYVLRASG